MRSPGAAVLASPATTDDGALLALRGFGVAFGERIILSDIDLEIPDRGVVVLLGPGGTGKSTLLRTIAGFNDANPSLRTWGEAEFLGMPLGDGERPALVAQSARLMMSTVLENVVSLLPERRTLTPEQQRGLAKRLLDHAGLAEIADQLNEPVVHLPIELQRHLSILRHAAGGPRMLCIDEPTTGLADSYTSRLLDYIRREAEHRAILVVLHNQAHARCLGGEAVLLAGGRIQERQPIPAFFDAPSTAPACEFARNGTCALPDPNSRPEDLDEGAPLPPPVPEQARHYVSDSFGPRGFLWLKRGILAGTPQPGIFFDIDYDLKALNRVGVTTLVTLTEYPMEAEPLERHGIRSVWEPITDMQPPGMEQAAKLCAEIETLTGRGEVVAVHCRAGLGRTGTVLAAYLIWEGHTGLDALEAVRRVEPRWVQSEEQVVFLEEFAGYLAKRRHRSRHPVATD